MTGPAKIAWIITPWMALMVLPLWAQAAAPRDAVRNMPTITHTSTFDIVSAENKGTHSYEDAYTGYWKVSWGTNKRKLASGAWATLDLTYETWLTDRLKRLSDTSQDTRRDRFTGVFKVNTESGYDVSFSLDQQDTLSGSTLSNTDRSWNSKTIKSVNAAWSRGGYPRITLAHKISNTYNYLGSQQTHGSEAVSTQFAAEYCWQALNEWQKAKIIRQFIRSDNYNTPFDDDHSGTSRDKTILEASRTFSYPHFGKFALNLRHEEDAYMSLGAVNSSTNYATQYSAALEGNVRNYPMWYSYKYWTQQAGSSGSAGNQSVKRELFFSLKPPVPAGKSGDVSYKHLVNEGNYTNNRKTTEEQNLTWNLKTNPQTTALFKYNLKQVTDRLAAQRTEDTENISASLRYDIPGGRGSITGGLSESIRRQPVSDQRSITESMNIGTSFTLGPGTSLGFYFNQRLDDTRTGLLGLPSGKDEFLSRVSYRTSGQGLILDATYEQVHKKTLTTEKKTDVERLNLKLSYQTDAKWKYSLTFKTNSESADSSVAEGYDYITGETIQAMVSYSF